MRTSLFVATTLLAAVSMAEAQAINSTRAPARIDSRVDSLRYNSNPSTLGPNDSRSQFGLQHRSDSRIRSRIDSFDYNTNPSQFRVVDPRTNIQRF